MVGSYVHGIMVGTATTEARTVRGSAAHLSATMKHARTQLTRLAGGVGRRVPVGPVSLVPLRAVTMVMLY